MVNLLFIHGLHGSPDNVLVKRIRKYVGKGYNIIAPAIPVNCCDAIKVVEEIRNEIRVDIITGISLGGFIALTQTDVARLVINPCLCPSADIRLLGATDEEAESYLFYERTLIHKVENADSFLNRYPTLGIFGARDELFRYGNLFSDKFPHAQILIVNDGHNLSKETVIGSVIPAIHNLIGKKI